MKTQKFQILFFYIFLLYATNGYAQRNIRDLDSNVDSEMTMRGDTIGKSGKNVPTEVRAWTVDEIFGNKKPINVDTLHHAYQNNSLSEGMRGEYNTLSNLGSPRINRIFMERAQSQNFIFADPFDQFLVPTNQFRHFNTKSPYMNVSYNACGSKTTGYDNLKVIYSQNIGKDVNFGGSYAYMYGQGYYNSQNTGFMNASAWASYNGDHYDMHMYYQFNTMKLAENGGITDETYITHPENQTIKYGSNDIPTFLERTWNRQEHHIVFLNQHYNLGFERIEGDSINKKIVFVPVMRIFHSLKVADMFRNYRAYSKPNDYHSFTYLRNDTTNDYTTHLSVRNNVGLSLCEGFQKWTAFGLNAYIGHEYRNYALPDTTNTGFNGTNIRAGKRKYTEYDLIVGGQLIRTMGSLIHYNVDAEFVFAGENTGQLKVDGHGEINIPFLKDTLQIAANACIKSINPSFYFRHFHSTYAWWDQETSKEWHQRIQGVVTFPKTGTTITGGIENIKNYAYFANNGIKINNKITNNAAALQHKDAIRVFSITLDQNFAFGPFHLDNNVTYQYSSNQTVLPLPTISTYNNLYFNFKIAKVLKTEVGADMKFFTEYYAPDYSPVIGQFTTQNPDKLVKIGGHPLISAYANFELKRLRFYIQYYHANAGTSRAFWGPGYPMNPSGIHFGLSWNFYD